ncbi:hypothetical protein BJX64DRAFT_288290 [Aspergillus heterothallicus]
MATPPRPASVLDVDERGNPILSSKRTAARVTKRHSDPVSRTQRTQEPQKTKSTTTSRQSEPTFIVGKSRCRGTSKDDSEERNQVDGACFREVFLTDETEILSPDAEYERQRYVKLVILISHQDEIHEKPTIFVEQHLAGTEQQVVVIHELTFGTGIRLGVEYVFPGCGDETQAFGKRDLFIRFQSLDASVFSQYIQRARGIEYSVVLVQGTTEVSPFKGVIDGPNLSRLMDMRKGKSQMECVKGSEVELLKLRFRGYGRWSKDRQYGGDVVLHFVYASPKGD